MALRVSDYESQMRLDFSHSPAVPIRDGDSLTREEQSVLKVLSSHAGRKNAIKAPVLAQAAGITPRQLRAVIEHLIEYHHARIGSTTQAPYGYFIIETAEDAEHACEQLRHRAMACLRRMAMLKKISMRELMGQLRLDYEGATRPRMQRDD
jgi:hypothetical protein